ncbi:MAG: hypothetical protein KDA90_19705 [Planctomycetaceae bacterium]|nr:hypothetical protein [Planctomycetaceae bacterium]
MIQMIALFLLVLAIESTHAAEWHVNPEVGSDKAAGSMAEPLATVQQAVKSASEGDTIYLHPEGAVYRQSVTLHSRSNLIIEGQGVTLDGADPLDSEGWETVEPDLFRKQLRRTPMDRHLLIVDGVMQRMGRTQSANSPDFPPIGQLKSGEFRFENIDEKTGWLYVRGSIDKLQWSTRVNGLATGGKCRNITVRNLHTRNFLNDGFNIHGDCRGLVFENITGYDCFDEGFSAHETSECVIEHGRFYGNENGIADVNAAETIYRHCEFRDNVNTDVLLIGLQHQLVDCTILNSTTAAALVAGPRTADQPFALQLERVAISTEGKQQRARVRVNGGTLTATDCKLTNVDFVTIGAEVKSTGLQIVNDEEQ